MKKILLSALALALLAIPASAQQSLSTPRSAVTQNFDSLGNSTSATLPTGWRVRDWWGTESTSVNKAAGTSGTDAINGSSTGGAFNWANGATATSTDRAVGFLSDIGGFLGFGAYLSPTSLNYAFTNNTTETIRALDLS